MATHTVAGARRTDYRVRHGRRSFIRDPGSRTSSGTPLIRGGAGCVLVGVGDADRLSRIVRGLRGRRGACRVAVEAGVGVGRIRTHGAFYDVRCDRVGRW